MKKLMMLVLAVSSLTYCQDVPKSGNTPSEVNALTQSTPTEASTAFGPSLTRVHGLMYKKEDILRIKDIDNEAEFALIDKTNNLEVSFNRSVQPCPIPGESAVAALSGRYIGLDKSGMHQFEVSKIDTLIWKSADFLNQAGIPYEFWCYGTEPFWDVSISHFEGVIFYQNLAEESGWNSPWVAPSKEGTDTWVYRVPANPGYGEAFTLKVKKQKAYDGVSDHSFDYAAEITIRGQKFKGVAIRGNAPLMGPGAEE